MSAAENKKNETYGKLSPQRKQLVDMVLTNLEKGTGLWKAGWQLPQAPESVSTGKKYRGVNNVFLSLTAMSRGYTDHRWITFNQMRERDWHFKTDEQGNSLGKRAGVSVEFFEFLDKKTQKPFTPLTLMGMSKDEQEEYRQENVVPMRKYYTVFNGDLIDGIPALAKSVHDPSGKNDRAESVIRYWSEHEAEILYGGNNCDYNHETDKIHLPEIGAFYNMQEYYSSALHEIGHSTGHETRLNRNIKSKFGSAEYAQEELRAEIASMFMEQELGIAADSERVRNNSAYIQNWKGAIEDNPNALFTAIADADKIAKFISFRASQKEEETAATEKDEPVGDAVPTQPDEKAPGEVRETTTIEPKNPIEYIRPSEVAASLVEASKPASVSVRGIESLTRMADREVVEKAGKTKNGEKFIALYRGDSLLGSEAKDERSLMNRIAMFCNGDEEQLMRVFMSSGQYREDKPAAYYLDMADEATRFIAEQKQILQDVKAGKPIPLSSLFQKG